MNKLKTLKEIKGDFGNLSFDDNLKFKIKTEAINWIKDCNCREGSLYCDCCVRFLEFFNITEKDLEEKEKWKKKYSVKNAKED